MINKFWTGVSLENYNNWYPLTGKITETPQQYINTWPNVNDWFKTFAIRAQNDINAYLDFILSKFPFDSFKDELIKETLRDMVYVMVEHWVFNRTPIEFNVDATIQFNNGNQFSANSTPTINVWDLAPSRMKIWARLTELKQIFSSYNNDEIDVEKIDLKAFYTRNQVDELIKEQKEFTLLKQIKLYDDLVDDNENEIYRGPVTKFINKGYVATDYDKETETMILDWPDEIGTLPPEALQNNPQIGDFTHAPTCDFSAKQQKRITANENNITKLNDELTKTNESIDDIKNNWFNIETSPLWKKIDNKDLYTNQWYIVPWTYVYFDSKQLSSSVSKLTKVIIEYNLTKEQMFIVVEKIIVEDNINITLSFDFNTRNFIVQTSSTKYKGWLDNDKLYQYKGDGIPIEFIAEESTEHDYYTKQETNNLLDKKQNINDDNLQTVAKQIVPAINENKKNIDNKIDKEQFQYAFAINTIGTKIPNLETTNKTIVGAINENKSNIDKKQDKLTLIKENNSYKVLQYNELGTGVFSSDLDIPPTKFIKQWITESENKKQDKITDLENRIFKDKIQKNEFINLLTNAFYLANTLFDENEFYGTNTKQLGNKIHLKADGIIRILKNVQVPELETYYKNIIDAINELNKRTKPLKISSKSLETNEVEENCWDIELKENPTPSSSNWKDVAFVEKNQISYELKNNTHYRIFYDNSMFLSKPGNFPCLIKEFYWIKSDEGAPMDLLMAITCIGMGSKFENTILVINKKRIFWLDKKQCDLWKLQELQD